VETTDINTVCHLNDDIGSCAGRCRIRMMTHPEIPRRGRDIAAIFVVCCKTGTRFFHLTLCTKIKSCFDILNQLLVPFLNILSRREMITFTGATTATLSSPNE
jgi:hypothetical protein